MTDNNIIAYAEKQVTMWENEIARGEQADDFYYTNGSYNEDLAQLNYWKKNVDDRKNVFEKSFDKYEITDMLEKTIIVTHLTRTKKLHPEGGLGMQLTDYCKFASKYWTAPSINRSIVYTDDEKVIVKAIARSMDGTLEERNKQLNDIKNGVECYKYICSILGVEPDSK